MLVGRHARESRYCLLLLDPLMLVLLMLLTMIILRLRLWLWLLTIWRLLLLMIAEVSISVCEIDGPTIIINRLRMLVIVAESIMRQGVVYWPRLSLRLLLMLLILRLRV